MAHETDTSYSLAESYVLEVIQHTTGWNVDENTVHVPDMETCDCIPVSVRTTDGAVWRLEKVAVKARPPFSLSGHNSLVATYHTED
jgi:hypothetical protein